METSNDVAGTAGVALQDHVVQSLVAISPTIGNLVFVMGLILFGSFLGGYAKWSRVAEEKDSIPIKNILFGAAASFMCVPFFSSVIHIDYQSIILPIETGKTAIFVQQALLLVSVSGIASYLGYALLDGIADKVLHQEIKKESEERKKQDENILNQNKTLRAEVLYLEAVTNTESAEKTGSKNLLEDALRSINEALTIYSENKDSAEYAKARVFKGYILKRLGRIQEALDIINEQLESGRVTPITLYNKACYLYMLRSANSDNLDQIKGLIRQAITLETTDKALNQQQLRIRTKIKDNKESDLRDLFDEAEREEIGKLECGKPLVDDSPPR
jgi:tetratricopeptide (TPR) repeat protein